MEPGKSVSEVYELSTDGRLLWLVTVSGDRLLRTTGDGSTCNICVPSLLGRAGMCVTLLSISWGPFALVLSGDPIAWEVSWLEESDSETAFSCVFLGRQDLATVFLEERLPETVEVSTVNPFTAES